jgi:hypothetical protein
VILRDPVHGLISFEDPQDQLVVRLMDTPEVQRLRRIRALGPASLAFPGAEHSRFAHAVGSAHVMKRYLGRVGTLAAELPRADRVDGGAMMTALAAALLHDVGHGPLSHSFEVMFPEWGRHEAWTSRILLDPSTGVHRVLAEADATLPGRVERLVHGQHEIPHLARAVSGTFDVDRCDYLLRDSYMTGVRWGLLDLDWLLRSLRLHHPREGAAAVLAVDGEKGLPAVEGFFLARLYMYRQVYLHKAVRAAEVLLCALARRVADLRDAGTPLAGPEALRAGARPDVPQWLALDDHVLQVAIATWADSDDAIASDLARRVQHRRLLKAHSLRPGTDLSVAEEILRDVLARQGFDARYYGAVDRVELRAYDPDDSLQVLQGGSTRGLVEVSQPLRQLSSEPFVHVRALGPAECRDALGAALAAAGLLEPAA